MPFPLAHPVAVLPFRRWCPHRLSFIGLVVGSITPDAGYAYRPIHLAGFSHSLPGSLAFCLPVGFIAACVVFAIRRPLALTLPAPHRAAVGPLCEGPFPAWWRLALSVLIGTWTHIAFDALTHESIVHARSLEVLQSVDVGSRSLYQMVWILISLGCMGLLGATYLRFLKRATGEARLFDPADRRRVLLWGALLSVPYLIVAPFELQAFEPGGVVINKHTLYRTLEPYLLLLTGAVAGLGLWLRFRGSRSRAPLTPRAATASSDGPVPPG